MSSPIPRFPMGTCAACMGLCLALAADVAGAVERVELNVDGAVLPSGARSGPAKLSLALGPAVSAFIRAERLRSAAGLELGGIEAECVIGSDSRTQSSVIVTSWRCERGQLALLNARGKLLTRSALRMHLDTHHPAPDPEDGENRDENRDIQDSGPERRGENRDTHVPAPAFSVHAPSLRFASGKVDARLSLEGEQLSAMAKIADVRLAPLAATGTRWALGELSRALTTLPARVTGGRVSGLLRLRGSPDAPRVTAALDLQGLTFADEAGSLAGEGVGARLSLTARPARHEWHVAADASLVSGELYTEPVYVKISSSATGPIRINLNGRTTRRRGALEVDRFDFVHDGVASVHGRASLRLTPKLSIDSAEVSLDDTPAAKLYAVYVEPFVAASAFAGARIRGTVGANLAFDSGTATAHLRLAGASLADAAGRFLLRDIGADLNWSSTGTPPDSEVRFARGEVYGIPLGGARVRARVAGRTVSLLSPVSVPMLEGAVSLRSLAVNASKSGAQWRLGAHVGPLSLAALTTALGWPAFGGTLDGEIPSVRYANGEVVADGALDVAVFGGRVRIRDLSLHDPFGAASRLTMNADVRGLDLKKLTGAFAFGSIEGRLGGRIRDLTLEQWRPVSFDARLGTPEGSSSRRRISQRAVKNLANIGGVGGALSGTFMGLFDTFAYDRLGIACVLANGVCEMGGVAPAESGYYIVKGGGWPPRIDVIGYNRRVDWDVLVERVKSATRSEGPVIK